MQLLLDLEDLPREVLLVPQGARGGQHLSHKGGHNSEICNNYARSPWQQATQMTIKNLTKTHNLAVGLVLSLGKAVAVILEHNIHFLTNFPSRPATLFDSVGYRIYD